MLNKLGIWNDIESEATRTHKTEFFHINKKPFPFSLSVYILKREKLDKILLDHAISCGAEFKVLRFTGNIEHQDEFSLCETEDNNSEIVKIKAKIVLLAMGCQHLDVLKNIYPVKPGKTDLIAARGYYHANWKIDKILAFWMGKYKNGGFLWIFPMGNNEYNIGCGTTSGQKIDLKKDLNEFVDEFSKKRNACGHWVSPVKGAFLRTNLANFKYASFANVLLAGEALGSTFPLSGEGIGMALETGIVAAEVMHKVLIKNDFSLLREYKKRINKELKIKYLPYRIGFFIFKGSFMKKLLNLGIVYKILLVLLIRCVKLCDCISKKFKV